MVDIPNSATIILKHGPALERSKGSPRYSLSNGASRVERSFIFDWRDRQEFARKMLGYCKIANRIDNAPHDTYIKRFLPDYIPDLTNPSGSHEPYLWATAITTMEGLGETALVDSDGVVIYKACEATVQYETLTYKLLDDDELEDLAPPPPGEADSYPDEATLQRFVTKQTKPGVEYIALPRGVMKWFDPRIALTRRPGCDYGNYKIQSSIELTFTWHQVPFVPDSIFTHIGCVNRDPFAVPRDAEDGTSHVRTYPPGTLLLLSADIKPYRMGVGAFVQDIVYRIKYFEPEPGRGHNFFLRYNHDLNSLDYIKLTKDGLNDTLAIPADNSPDPETFPPYQAFVPAGPSKSVYPYRTFANLFRWHTP